MQSTASPGTGLGNRLLVTSHLSDDEVGKVRNSRVVEHERRGQPNTRESSLRAIPELDCREAVQAHVHEWPLDVDPTDVAQHVFEDLLDRADHNLRSHGAHE